MIEEQLLLPFEEIVEKKTGNLDDLPYFENPKNDNERLLNLQYEYRKGEEKALTQIYTISINVCKKFIAAKAKGNRHIRQLSSEQKEEKAIDATNYVIMRFIKKKNWYIKTSFTAYLYLRVLHELYHQRKVDKIVSFIDLEEYFMSIDNQL